MTARVPLTTLASQALIAFTIEFDNESERQFADLGLRRTPPSQVMWSNFMQFVGEEGVRLREVESLARITNLAGLERWGYISLGPDPADSRPAPPRRDWLVRPTPVGRQARQVWRPMASVIEKRWQERFGTDQIRRLTDSLQALVSQFDRELPQYLPVVSYANGMRASLPEVETWPSARGSDGIAPPPDISVLLSQVLLAFTIEFECESSLSLAISANVLRVLDTEGVRIRDLPHLSGVSKEAISASVGFMARHGYVVVGPDPTASRVKLARLTPKGRRSLEAYRQLLEAVEERWQARFGESNIRVLHESLHNIVAGSDGEPSRLSLGLVPQDAGWRARRPYLTQTSAVVRDPRGALPHYPMVLHRGGWPDGN